jgi:outer membrane protein assembly factor BamB
MFSDIDSLTNREELEKRRKIVIKRRRIILFSIVGVLAIFILFVCLYNFTNVMFGISESLESAPQSGDWAMFHHDLAHTGATDISDPTPNGTLQWKFETGAPIHSSPAVVDGVVYFGSRDHHIYALDAETGAVIWSYETGSWVESSPAVVDGVVYCGSNDGNLYALDATSGTMLWSLDLNYAVRSSPAVAGGKVYVGSDDYHIYAADAKTGKKLWGFKTDNLVISSPAVSRGIVVAGSMDGDCYTLNASNGRRRLDFETGSPISASPVVIDGTVYISNPSVMLYAIDSAAKNWLWENKISVYWRALYVYGVAPKPPLASGYIWSQMFFGKVSSSPAYLDGNIYLGMENTLLSVDSTNKKVNWSFKAGDWVLSSPAVTEKAVFFGSYDMHFYALDRATGVKLWDVATGDKITSSPAVSGGSVYFGSEDGFFYAYK